MVLASSSATGGLFGALLTVYIIGALVAYLIGIMAHGVRKRNRRKSARASLAWPATLIRIFRGTNQGRATDSSQTQTTDHDTSQVTEVGPTSDVPGPPSGSLTIKQYGLIEEPDE
jgi:hypothetical protein